ncbi:hypothetical protein ACFLRS_01160 [Campylobacterota bacterium]
MKRIILFLLFAYLEVFAMKSFGVNRMQFGCQSIADYERADNTKGYGAGKVFTESGCIYLSGLDLVYKESKNNHIQVCRKDSPKMCYWTVDTRY